MDITDFFYADAVFNSIEVKNFEFKSIRNALSLMFKEKKM